MGRRVEYWSRSGLRYHQYSPAVMVERGAWHASRDGCDTLAAGPLAGAVVSAPIYRSQRSLVRPYPPQSYARRDRGASP